ncbi:VTT domain-containing protein [Henriciella sp.]|uniref:TVP38/TMEM64 family protein n=1 Tax=Henriciella sp. TaxID=1968823 RepID=UPI00261C931E|nr:VTT domain-containing protein [Henriciella sp.]
MADKENSAPENRSIWIRLWPVYIIAAGLIAAWQFGLFQYLSLETLQEQNTALQSFVDEHLLLAIIAYVVIYAAATAFMIPGALWITIAGGLGFGLIGGSLATVTGATLGASILFLAAKTSIGKTLQERAGKFVKRMESGFKENAISYMFALRLLPAIPFPVANIAPALLGAKFRDYVLTTALGIIPGVVAYTWIGASLGMTFDAGDTESLFDVVKNFVPAFIALAVVALLPVIYRKFAGNKAARLEDAAQ